VCTVQCPSSCLSRSRMPYNGSGGNSGGNNDREEQGASFTREKLTLPTRLLSSHSSNHKCEEEEEARLSFHSAIYLRATWPHSQGRFRLPTWKNASIPSTRQERGRRRRGGGRGTINSGFAQGDEGDLSMHPPPSTHFSLRTARNDRFLRNRYSMAAGDFSWKQAAVDLMKQAHSCFRHADFYVLQPLPASTAATISAVTTTPVSNNRQPPAPRRHLRRPLQLSTITDVSCCFPFVEEGG